MAMDTLQRPRARSADRPAHRETSAAARRAGYTVAIAVNAVLLYLINRSPGWEAVPFLTDDTPRVLGLVNASIVSGIVANAVYVLWDPRWLRALGDVVTTAVGLAALVQLWVVFPVAFAPAAVDWELVARWVLGVGIAGSVIGIVVALVRLGRALVGSRTGQ
jgi:hypothetical protein